MTVAVRPLTDAVGVEILGVDLRRLSDAAFAAVARARHQPSVMPLGDQKLRDGALVTFGRRFRELRPPPNQERGRISPPGYPDSDVVSNVLNNKGEPIGALGAGEAVWHTDMSYLDMP